MNILCEYRGNKVDPICFQFDKQYFPCDDWDDFCPIIVGWWLSEIKKIRKLTQVEFKLWFMDGPYYLCCTKNAEIVSFAGIDHDEQIFFEEKVHINVLQQCVEDVARKIIEYDSSVGVNNKDILSLKDRLNMS